jgi:hypothetical protein
MGLVAAVNLSLIAGTMAVLVGPTLLEGKTSLEGGILGVWTAVSVFLLLLNLRGNLHSSTRWLLALALVIAMSCTLWGLNRGLPVYRAYAARSLVQALGGSISAIPSGEVRVDLGGTKLNDGQLKQVVERLRSIGSVTELSLARTQVTDQGLPSLKPLTALKRIDLTGTNVSRGGKTILQRSLPDVEIVD